MKNSGIDTSFLGEDAEPRLQALSVLARDEAQAGIRTIVTDTFGEFGNLEEYDVQDLSSIALRIQGIVVGRAMDKEFKTAVSDSISTSYFTSFSYFISLLFNIFFYSIILFFCEL